MYQPRRITTLQTVELYPWRWKQYYIAFDASCYDEPLIAASTASLNRLLARAGLPAEYQVGFSIIHAGRDMNFVIHGYWTNGNELALAVFKALPGRVDQIVRSDNNGSSIACVWDLAVIGHERQAWIDHILGPETPNVDAYLNTTMNGYR